MFTVAVGTWLYPIIRKKFKPSALLKFGLFLFSFSYIILGVIPIITTKSQVLLYTLFCLSAVIYGFGIAMVNMVVNVSFMQKVDTHYLARIGGLFNAMVMSALPLMSFLSAPIVKSVQVNQFYVIIGVLGFILGIVVLLSKVFSELNNTNETKEHSNELSSMQEN